MMAMAAAAVAVAAVKAIVAVVKMSFVFYWGSDLAQRGGESGESGESLIDMPGQAQPDQAFQNPADLAVSHMGRITKCCGNESKK